MWLSHCMSPLTKKKKSWKSLFELPNYYSQLTHKWANCENYQALNQNVSHKIWLCLGPSLIWRHTKKKKENLDPLNKPYPTGTSYFTFLRCYTHWECLQHQKRCRKIENCQKVGKHDMKRCHANVERTEKSRQMTNFLHSIDKSLRLHSTTNKLKVTICQSAYLHIIKI